MIGPLKFQRSRRSRLAYPLLMAAQTVAATVLFRTMFPIFARVVEEPGKFQLIERSTQFTIVAAAVVLQVCYWTRFRYVRIEAPTKSPFVAHLFLFGSRISFFFGGALFSAIFFRHLPELDALPPLFQGVTKVGSVLAVLFSLFCYSLELDRVGRAIEAADPARQRPQA